MDYSNLINCWKEAAEDLNFKIITPFILLTSDNTKISFPVLIEKFGSKLGTLVLSNEDMTNFYVPREYGYYCSVLSDEGYSIYKRDYIIDTLNDWGYFGDDSEKPSWYTGQPWSSQ
jgi:hypothetical protein